MTILLAAMAVIALISGGPIAVLQGFAHLQTASARLINDFTHYGSSVALFNSASVGALALILVYFASISLSGPTLACVLTMMGFSLFGNTLLNTTPIILGVYLASKVAGKTFGAYSIIALFGTALGPLVTYIMFGLGLPLIISIPLALACGILALCGSLEIPKMIVSISLFWS